MECVSDALLSKHLDACCKNRLLALLVASCAELIGDSGLDALSVQERQLVGAARGLVPHEEVDAPCLREAITQGGDPLGAWYCELYSPHARHTWGQFYTPSAIVRAMSEWAMGFEDIGLVVDPGCGSGRFGLAALSLFRQAECIAVDIDPLATLMTRASARVLGLDDRLTVCLGDFRDMTSADVHGAGRTLFVGNPPYVRHHLIEREWKDWFGASCKRLGVPGTKLAGLHAHFYLATALLARPGDIGVYITSSEWLSTNYGKTIRTLLSDELGLLTLQEIDPSSKPFDDATTTGVIAGFEVHADSPHVRVGRVESAESLGTLSSGSLISRDKLKSLAHWGVIARPRTPLPAGYTELGSIARVHRGAVTGANKVWVCRENTYQLPSRLLHPTITRAHELFDAGDRIENPAGLRMVVDLPCDLDELDASERSVVDEFLTDAQSRGAADGYVARNRKCWWSIGLTAPAPILATYMARRPPAFVRNDAKVHHLNIAHGIYPQTPMSEAQLDCLALYLRTNVALEQGRTYAGGLTKFEPREMERIVVPTLSHLDEWRRSHAAKAS